jgi:enolase-phosphatase E1
MIRFAGRAILLDIEGTVAPISFVVDVLFPFARKHAETFLRENWTDFAVAVARERIARDAGAASFEDWVGRATLSEDAVSITVAEVNRLMDADAKTTGLKELQGLIWKRGYATGELKSQLFDDVAPALRGWAKQNIDVRIYSSGSIAAQQVFFRHTVAGDLSGFLCGYYDTTIGSKREAESYRRIAADMAAPAGSILFLSDVPAELDAAAAAGLRTGLAIRPGNAAVPHEASHPRFLSLAEIEIQPTAGR